MKILNGYVASLTALIFIIGCTSVKPEPIEAPKPEPAKAERVSASAAAKVLPKTARLIPPETVFLVDVDDFNELKTQFEKTNLYKFYKDPAMAAFVEDFKTKLREKIQQLDDNDVFKTIFNADVLPQGRAAVALVPNEQARDVNESTILIITQWGEQIDKIKEAVSKMLEKNIELGGHQKRSEDYRGVDIETIIDEASGALNYCFIDDCLIAATNPDLLKFVIAHIKGASSPTLASDTDFTDTMRAIGPYHDIDFYVNIKQIIETILAKDSTGKTQTKIACLGLDNVRAAGCSLGFGKAVGSSACGKAFVRVEGEKKGICKMLEVESAVLRTPRFIPASAYSATFLNLNIKKAYDELYNILYSLNPTTAALIPTMLLPAGPAGERGLDLKADFINHLGSQIILAQNTRRPFSSGSVPVESLVALAVNNRGALEESVSILYSEISPEARRELLGYTIYLISLPPLQVPSGEVTPLQEPSAPSTLQMPNLAFTITDTHLIFGVESTVERAIRALSSNETASFSSAEWFSWCQSAIPSVVGLAFLEDTAASGELFWWMMKEGQTSKNPSISLGISVSPNLGLTFLQSGLFNFSLLPEFDAVRKYFGLSTFYGISRPDGFFFELKYLNPRSID
jgi:hypothetical protein